jgi:hypothetical protein
MGQTAQRRALIVTIQEATTCLGTIPVFERLKRGVAAVNHIEIQVIRLEVGGLCSICTA